MSQTIVSLKTTQADSFENAERRLSIFAFIWIVGFFLPAALLPLHLVASTEQDGYPFVLIPNLFWILSLFGCIGLFVRRHRAKLHFVDVAAIGLCCYLFLFSVTPSRFAAAWVLFFLAQFLQSAAPPHYTTSPKSL